MRKRCIVNVATDRYVAGQDRLNRAMAGKSRETDLMFWRDTLPPGSPAHMPKPYAFKAWALKAAADAGHTELLWLDACILPNRELEPLWEKIERDGYWIVDNGYKNGEWTCDAAYRDLGVTREENWKIPHVVATAFGLSLSHPVGQQIFDEYFGLAQTNAFCGPWRNENGAASKDPMVRGHRHDQTALSVAAWRADVVLTQGPEFAYKGGETVETYLIADGKY